VPPRAGARTRREARLGEAPKPPWHPVPLVELTIFAGLVLTVAGFATGGSPGGILVTGGVVLVSLGALELTIREHVSGYRSHSALLALVAAVVTMAATAVGGLPRVAVLAAGVVVGAAAFVALRELFQRKSGGLTWRA
jgi:hypothetical protein